MDKKKAPLRIFEGGPLLGNEVLDDGYIGSGRAFGSLLDVEIDAISLVQHFEAFTGDLLVVNENIFFAFRIFNESISLVVVKPFYPTLHVVLLPPI